MIAKPGGTRLELRVIRWIAMTIAAVLFTWNHSIAINRLLRALVRYCHGINSPCVSYFAMQYRPNVAGSWLPMSPFLVNSNGQLLTGLAPKYPVSIPDSCFVQCY
jgi:hypothetical protein